MNEQNKKDDTIIKNGVIQIDAESIVFTKGAFKACDDQDDDLGLQEGTTMESQEMNRVYFKDGKIYLNGNRIPYVTDIEIKKHVGDSTNVKIEFLAKVKDLDSDQLRRKEGAQGMDSIEIDVALYRGSHRLTQAELFELKKSNPSKEELDKFTVKLTQRTLK